MTQPQYALSWDSYKTNICSGFSSLQQNGEFVDMTIAADGHLVKVHQVLVALASPFLKELIASAPCQHPVIFLNNVSHKVLSYLLEFIYTGEAIVPSDNLPGFMEAAKSLHIRGLEGISDDQSFVPNDDINSIIGQHEQEIAPRIRGAKRKASTSLSETLESSMEEQSDIEMTDRNSEIEEVFVESFSPELSNERAEDSTVKLKTRASVNTDVFSEIIPYKGDSRWFTRGGEYYVVSRSRKNCFTLKCSNLRCEVQWSLQAGIAGPIKGQHNHEPTPWVPSRNAMFQALKGRAAMDDIPLKDIYNQEANRYPDAAPHLLYENVAPSMRKWRKNAKEE